MNMDFTLYDNNGQQDEVNLITLIWHLFAWSNLCKIIIISKKIDKTIFFFFQSPNLRIMTKQLILIILIPLKFWISID